MPRPLVILTSMRMQPCRSQYIQRVRSSMRHTSLRMYAGTDTGGTIAAQGTDRRGAARPTVAQQNCEGAPLRVEMSRGADACENVFASPRSLLGNFIATVWALKIGTPRAHLRMSRPQI